MRILGIGSRIELGDLYLTLAREGHEVRVSCWDQSHAGVLEGLLPRVTEWRDELSWVGRDGLLLFERVGNGPLQDELRREGYQVLGGSALGDRLEYDRAFGQSVLRDGRAADRRRLPVRDRAGGGRLAARQSGPVRAEIPQ